MDPSGDGGGGLTATGLLCGSCGAELPPNSKFCNECGAAVTQVSRSAEYKQVTVLFADVVRSMDLAAALDVERWREIVTELVERSAAVVRHYGGTVEFTGDGVMAVFGAPVALEDHAVRACLAALAIQQETSRLAEVVARRDGVALRVRVGLNSGEVIAGEIGSGSLGYAAIGEQMGMAQRMESVAPPGGVMLSASTARLVDRAAVLDEPELVRIKGADQPVAARRLLGMEERHRLIERAESDLVGRRWELSAVEGVLDSAVEGHGAVVGFVGPPGIGKSRLVREVAAMARARGVEVLTAFCESHTSQVPFYAVARLLRAATGVEGLDGRTARAQVRSGIAEADPQDLLLLDDLLGIADPNVPLPAIDPDARRRRLTALVNAAALARESPAVYVIEDIHWIDEVSESMLAEFFAVIPQTPSLVLVTYRPEYDGALSRMAGAQTVSLAPLSDSETAALTTGLLGHDPSVGELGQKIAERAAGNPFFAEEMVRELAERGVLLGQPGTYVSSAESVEVSVPATLQATIAARIDRLRPEAKRTLSAAAVIGSRFVLDLLTGLGIEPAIADLVAGQLIDQVSFARRPEYVFHHPLIRRVAYESQLKSDRAELHRRLAASIQERYPESVEENAALIAEHLEAAGDLHAAYGWHMRAGGRSANRDLSAAQVSWERARQVADLLPDDVVDSAALRIAPRTLLCSSGWRVHASISGPRFDELRELCTLADDKTSLAIGMTGLAVEHMVHARIPEASWLASELMAVLESIGDPTMTVGLSFGAIFIKMETADWPEALRWSQTVIDLADGDAGKGNLIIGSPLAFALASRGVARWCLGRPGWRDDLNQAVVMARRADTVTQAYVISAMYATAIPNGVLLADETALSDLEELLLNAERSADDIALGSARIALGLALMHRDFPDRKRGLQLLGQAHGMCHERFMLSELPIVDVYIGRERAGDGDRDGAIPVMSAAVDDLHIRRQLGWFIPATYILVETLLDGGSQSDIAAAEAATERLAAAPVDYPVVFRDITLLRLRALLAQAQGDDTAYRDYRDRYRAMAESLGFEGHIKWAKAMP